MKDAITCSLCGKPFKVIDMTKTHKCNTFLKLMYEKEFNWVSVAIFGLISFLYYDTKWKWFGWFFFIFLWFLIHLYEKIKDYLIRKFHNRKVKNE